MPRYIVCSMEIEYESTYDPTTERFREYYLVDADTKRKAQWAAFQRDKQLSGTWRDAQVYENVHPLSDCGVFEAPEEVPSDWGDYYVKAT